VQPGQAFHMNYAISYEVTSGIRVGLNGYWLKQLTDDIPGFPRFLTS
jgi:hypothetical protein